MTDARTPPQAGDLHRVPCVGCGGMVPDIDGPTHAYMIGSPGCWQVYGELMARSRDDVGLSAAHYVDCYAAQHPGGGDHDRRQRRSVAVHLTSLCLLLEHNAPVGTASARRGRMSRTVLPRIGRTDWPHLVPPASFGEVTVVEVHAAHGGENDSATDGGAPHPISVRRWAEAVWSAWADHHDVVRHWAGAALAGRA